MVVFDQTKFGRMPLTSKLLIAVVVVFLISKFSEYFENNKEQTKTECSCAAQQTFKKKPPILEPLASKDLGPAGKATAAEELERIWNYIYDRQYHCTESEYLGGRDKDGDGAYDLCTEKQFWPFPDKTNSEKCLVYSFGIHEDFTFDDAIANRGCEVHSFDPSTEIMEDNGVRESGVIFHKVGVAAEDDDNGFKGWKMRTLKTLMKELGHQNRHLDFLKVDTDKHDGSGFETTVMQELLDSGLYKCIRQYSMEIHMPGPLADVTNLELCRTLYRQMRELNEGGWRLYNTTDNVRFLQRKVDPNYSQRQVKERQMRGKKEPILWESSFVNFDVEGPCAPYL